MAPAEASVDAAHAVDRDLFDEVLGHQVALGAFDDRIAVVIPNQAKAASPIIARPSLRSRNMACLR